MKSLMLFAGVAAIANMTYATEITFSSSLTANNSGAATEAYTSSQINSIWDKTPYLSGSSAWISFDTAGMFGCNAAHDQTANKGTSSTFCAVPLGDVFSFTQTFDITGAPSGTYTLYVLADDSTSVKINSTTLMAAGTDLCNTAGDPAVNCITPTAIVIPLADLVAGSNTLTFNVVQNLANSEYGLNFDLQQTVSGVPDPGSLGLLGSGLIGVGLLGRHRHRGKSQNSGLGAPTHTASNCEASALGQKSQDSRFLAGLRESDS